MKTIHLSEIHVTNVEPHAIDLNAWANQTQRRLQLLEWRQKRADATIQWLVVTCGILIGAVLALISWPTP